MQDEVNQNGCPLNPGNKAHRPGAGLRNMEDFRGREKASPESADPARPPKREKADEPLRGQNSMPLVGAPRQFDRIAKEFHVDYAFHKVSPGHYLLFFKAGQADAMTAAFQKYSDKVLNKGKDKASILGQLRNLSEHIKSRPKERQKTREAVKEER